MEPGDTVVVRATEEHARVIAVLDAAGTLLIQVEGSEPFQAQRDEVEPPWARHAGCSCCS